MLQPAAMMAILLPRGAGRFVDDLATSIKPTNTGTNRRLHDELCGALSLLWTAEVRIEVGRWLKALKYVEVESLPRGVREVIADCQEMIRTTNDYSDDSDDPAPPTAKPGLVWHEELRAVDLVYSWLGLAAVKLLQERLPELTVDELKFNEDDLREGLVNRWNLPVGPASRILIPDLEVLRSIQDMVRQ
jgi:hypothetical protein